MPVSSIAPQRASRSPWTSHAIPSSEWRSAPRRSWRDGGCLLKVSFYGADRVVESYNLMGPVKAALEASVRYIAAELAQIQAESLGWTPLEPGAYLHVGDPNATVIEVVGVPHADMKGLTVLLLS